MFQFISLGGSCSFLHLGTVQERYHKEKDLFFSGTDSLNTRNMDKLSVDYFMKICGADAYMWNDSFWIIRYRCLMNLDTKNVQIKVFILYILAANRF